MLINKETTRSLLVFYAQDPFARYIVQEDPYNVVIWEQIFIFFYKKNPKDEKMIPAHYRKGQGDPLWGELLHARQALTCHEFVLKIFARRKKYLKQTQKAA
jgi:hypothetical protein